MAKHLMVDLETLGNKSNSIITQISCVEFNIETGETFEVFNQFVNPISCESVGLKINADTVMWWIQQSDESRSNVDYWRIAPDLIQVLTQLRLFINNTEYEGIWGNSARFDLGLLENAYDACGIDYPIKFWLERDVRTALMLNPDSKSKFTNQKAHDAIEDCKFQIKYIVDAINTHKSK